jgi:hypothetical protein
MHAACLEAEIPGSVSKSEPVQGATIACVTPGTRSDSVRFAHSHEQSYDAVYIRSVSIAKRWSRRTGASVKGRIESRGVGLIYPVGGEPGARAKIGLQ